MSTRRARSLTARPLMEDLEGRRLLAATFRGTDIDGDTYTLRLAGPGDLRVTQVNADGTAHTDASTPALIDRITIAGGDPTQTRLIGRVTRGASGDGRVFFNNMTELGGRSEGTPANNGIQAVDAPNFWLGATVAAANTADPHSISIPDGVNTLRFGGVDAGFTIPGGTAPGANGVATTFNISLGLPRSVGTSIIVDQVISTAQASATAGGTATQNAVNFVVVGRLNLFQANAIQGNAALPSTGLQGGGGTLVVSTLTGDQSVTGQIGFVRVGGNATNFSVQTNDKVSNTYIGGETDHFSLLAPNGSRSLYFGKGLDNSTIRTHEITTLSANRGAVGSNITVDRGAGQVRFGGDVVNTNFITGVQQNLGSIFTNQTLPTNPSPTQDGGNIQQLLVAGNIFDSVFSASVDPSGGVYGTANDLTFPHGIIRGKIEGSINNASTVSAVPKEALFAHSVVQTGGPVRSPNVPEAPFPNAGAPPKGPRIARGLQAAAGGQAPVATSAASHLSTAKVKIASTRKR